MDPWGGLLKWTRMAWFLLVKHADVRWGVLKRLFIDGLNLLMHHNRLLGARWLGFVAHKSSRLLWLHNPPRGVLMHLRWHLLEFLWRFASDRRPLGHTKSTLQLAVKRKELSHTLLPNHLWLPEMP